MLPRRRLRSGFGDRLAQANALLDLGVVQHETGHYPDAAGSLQAARAIYRDLGDRLGQANVIRELGVIGERHGQYPDAADVLEEALSIYRDVGDALGQANALVWLGHMRPYLREYPAATGALETALGIFGDLGNRLGQAGALWRLGQVRLWTGGYRRAAELMEAGLGISRDLGDGLNQARALQRLAALHCRPGITRARPRSWRLLWALPGSWADRLDEGLALWGLGVVWQLTGDHRDAAEALETALAIHRDLGALHNQAEHPHLAGHHKAADRGRPGCRAGRSRKHRPSASASATGNVTLRRSTQPGRCAGHRATSVRPGPATGRPCGWPALSPALGMRQMRWLAWAAAPRPSAAPPRHRTIC